MTFIYNKCLKLKLIISMVRKFIHHIFQVDKWIINHGNFNTFSKANSHNKASNSSKSVNNL